ncbi:hypothetical protein TTHERM_001055648 (macronuclear) [Tetrahymena thermophila SB210]|uniref:Uncharacterized protein n=1 Tax=Tetrahymena thermophila (strain SB210) TaxID=312017 RepID=W7XBJ7_TETTS|nr:hypothetical protein TTHERM_001055648 [Tetrahymena thermophila SB210]EWS71051.1 hypothetical protein TTHERM_001055648 [Tetrahymena thermophila SB210]|eukprot:XP_012656417.1 hypothetical protein TTHERM_001055648 [Tetrahymena thermophila SB210]
MQHMSIQFQQGIVKQNSQINYLILSQLKNLLEQLVQFIQNKIQIPINFYLNFFNQFFQSYLFIYQKQIIFQILQHQNKGYPNQKIIQYEQNLHSKSIKQIKKKILLHQIKIKKLLIYRKKIKIVILKQKIRNQNQSNSFIISINTDKVI